jgi:hypothetical protein
MKRYKSARLSPIGSSGILVAGIDLCRFCSTLLVLSEWRSCSVNGDRAPNRKQSVVVLCSVNTRPTSDATKLFPLTEHEHEHETGPESRSYGPLFSSIAPQVKL